MSLSEDALVTVCLNTRLGRGESVRPFTVAEWTELVLALQRDGAGTPRDLLGKTGEDIAREHGIHADLASRIEELLRGLGSVGVEIERLESTGIWILTRGDEAYPRAWKRRLGRAAPPVVFGAGPRSSLGADLVAILGSRSVDEAGEAFARGVAELCARDGWGVVSGGARGVDQVAVDAALARGGLAVEVVADSLERAIAKRPKREAILEDRLTVLTPYLPGGRFTAGKAMGRNRLIYSLGRYACIAASDKGRGGTWSGATEALRKNLAPVFVRSGEDAPEGNRALINVGAHPLRLPLAASVAELFAAHDKPAFHDGQQTLFEF